MRKIIIVIVVLLLAVMAYMVIFNGVEIGNLLNILGVKQISEANDNLSKEITQTNDLITIVYPEKVEQLKDDTKTLLSKKKEYFDLLSTSTEKEIKNAVQEKEYRVEFLWTRVGTYGTSEGVNLKMDITGGDTGDREISNLNFTVTGSYIGIINFIYGIENDSQLEFKIENFKLVPGTSDIDLSATFIVKGIRITSEETTTSVETRNDIGTSNNEENTQQEGISQEEISQ